MLVGRTEDEIEKVAENRIAEARDAFNLGNGREWGHFMII